jgi:enterochelin esterase-like enzyme
LDCTRRTSRSRHQGDVPSVLSVHGLVFARVAAVVKKNVFSERWNTAENSRGKSSVHEPCGVATFRDGVDRCPVLLFTGGPQFTERSGVQDRLDNLLAKCNIDPSRIVVVKEKKYVSESQATIQHYLKRYSALRMSDPFRCKRLVRQKEGRHCEGVGGRARNLHASGA